MECVFCEIVEGKKFKAIICENEHGMSILDAYPLVEGHTLVIPRKHHENMLEITKIELNGIFDLIIETERRLLENLPCQGIDLRQHYRPFVPETKLSKHHLHVHLIPRKSHDQLFEQVGSKETALRTEPSEKEMKELALKISGKQKTL